MRTQDRRARKRAQWSMLSELPPSDAAEALELMRPMLRRIRNGDFRIALTGADAPSEQAAAAEFSRQFGAWVELLETRG